MRPVLRSRVRKCTYSVLAISDKLGFKSIEAVSTNKKKRGKGEERKRGEAMLLFASLFCSKEEKNGGSTRQARRRKTKRMGRVKVRV